MRLHTEVLKPDISTFACRVISLFGVMDPLLETARNIGFVGSLEFRSEQQPEPKPSLIQPIPHSQAIACVESSQFSVSASNCSISWVSVVSCWMFSDYMFNLHSAKNKHVSRARPC